MVKTMVHRSYKNKECGNEIQHVPHVANEGCGNEAHAILFWIDEHWELSPCKPWNLMLRSNPSLTYYYWIDNHLYCAASFVANFFPKNNILSNVPLNIAQNWKTNSKKSLCFYRMTTKSILEELDDIGHAFTLIELNASQLIKVNVLFPILFIIIP